MPDELPSVERRRKVRNEQRVPAPGQAVGKSDRRGRAVW